MEWSVVVLVFVRLTARYNADTKSRTMKIIQNKMTRDRGVHNILLEKGKKKKEDIFGRVIMK